MEGMHWEMGGTMQDKGGDTERGLSVGEMMGGCKQVPRQGSRKKMVDSPEIRMWWELGCVKQSITAVQDLQLGAGCSKKGSRPLCRLVE
jgi:hypothetical protein